jgi:hypothetical protein
MNVTWDHFWLGVVITTIVLLIVVILWMPFEPEDTDADSTDR